MHPAIMFTGITYIAGGFLFAIALFRANVLARWTAALVGLGYSLWCEAHTLKASVDELSLPVA